MVPNSLRVLLVEDNPADGRLISHALKRAGFEVEAVRVDSEDSLLRELRNAWDIILCDWSLPQFDAQRALEIVRDHDLDVPFIIVSGSIGEEAAVQVIKMGATDYLLKDRLTRLGTAIEHALGQRELRRAERAARESLQAREEQYRLLADTIPQLVWTATRDGAFDYINENVTDYCGLGIKDLIGDGWKQVVHPDDLESTQGHWFEALRSGQPREFGCRLRRVDGAYRWHIVRQRVVRDAAGDVIRWFGTCTDIHEQRVLEEQFHQAQKMEAVGRLAGGVAHDFNNMLTVINGYCEILLEEPPSDLQQQAAISAILDAGRRASALTSQLLAFSRKAIIEPQVVDLNELLIRLERLLKRLIGEDILLKVELAPALGRIKADPHQLDQVIMNLAVNSRDAMPTGGSLIIQTKETQIEIPTSTRTGDMPPGRYVALTVGDSGRGMSSAVLESIFEPFFTTKGPGRGTGLGLAVVHGVVKQAGGYIEVASSPNSGTTFELYFPLVTPLLAQDTPVKEMPPPSGFQTILLVEDEEAVRKIARLALEARGYHVYEAARGKDAIQLLDEQPRPIDLLVTDVVMPGMGGKELANRLRQAFPSLRVLFVSGYTDHEVVDHGVHDTSDYFLQKPFTPASLARKVAAVLA